MQNLQKGDLIVVAYNNYLLYSVYIKTPKNHPHYYIISDWMVKAINDGKRPRVDYMNRDQDKLPSFIKVDPDLLDKTTRDKYEFIKNYVINDFK